MRIIVFSDSHGNFRAIERIIELHPEADVFFHLGDGEAEMDIIKAIYNTKSFFCVCGNCDPDSMEKATRIVQLAGKTIYFTHGHTQKVKYDENFIVDSAKEANADILLYGHTHCSRNEYVNGLYVMNPGSVFKPANTLYPTYGIIDITGSGILTNIAELKYE